MRPGEPEGGPISDPDKIEALTRALLDREPGLNPIHARRAVKYLGTVVSADPDTLAFLDIDPDSFMPLQKGITETVDWFCANEGVTWTSPGPSTEA